MEEKIVCPKCDKPMSADANGKFTHCKKSWFSWRGYLRPWSEPLPMELPKIEDSAA